MKECAFCQAKMADDDLFCPKCGKKAEQAVEEQTAEMAAEEQVAETQAAPEAEPVEEAAVQAEPAQEESAAEEEPVEAEAEQKEEEEASETEESEKQPEKKATPGKIAVAVAAVVVLAAILIALILAGMQGNDVPAETQAPAETTVQGTVPPDGNPEDVTCKGTYTGTDEAALAAVDTVVATIGEHQLTNGQLQVYYWSMINSFLRSEYGYYMMMYGALNYTQPLDTQICAEDNTLTWQQYFIQEALNYWQLSISLATEAEKAGVPVSDEDQAQLDGLPANLDATAAQYGLTRDQLLVNNMGPTANLDDYLYFQQIYAAGRGFYEAELEKLVPTQEQLEAFFAEHEEGYLQSGITKDKKYVDVRHILVMVDGGTTDANGVTTHTDEEWEACRQGAQAILDQWLAGDKTEDSFAALANEKSADGGSNTKGGLYENVYEGQMVPPFEQWCFDESRQYGDYGLVQTDYGYHVMFFVESRPMWLSYAENDWVTEQANLFIENLIVGYPLEVEYGSILLGNIKLG